MMYCDTKSCENQGNSHTSFVSVWSTIIMCDYKNRVTCTWSCHDRFGPPLKRSPRTNDLEIDCPPDWINWSPGHKILIFVVPPWNDRSPFSAHGCIAFTLREHTLVITSGVARNIWVPRQLKRRAFCAPRKFWIFLINIHKWCHFTRSCT